MIRSLARDSGLLSFALARHSFFPLRFSPRSLPRQTTYSRKSTNPRTCLSRTVTTLPPPFLFPGDSTTLSSRTSRTGRLIAQRRNHAASCGEERRRESRYCLDAVLCDGWEIVEMYELMRRRIFDADKSSACEENSNGVLRPRKGSAKNVDDAKGDSPRSDSCCATSSTTRCTSSRPNTNPVRTAIYPYPSPSPSFEIVGIHVGANVYRS